MTKLPTPGSAVEMNRLDCKAKYDDGDKRRFEMAKDVAAFANANGGRLLIGSVEHGGLLMKHVGLPKAEAIKTRRDFDEAVRDLIHPPPVIDFPEWVAVDDDKVVLIVEVQPFPGQAVGVRIGNGDSASWVFPVRVGTQTKKYSPEQLVLLMDVAIRRKAQLLSAVGDEQLFIIANANGFETSSTVVRVRPEMNTFWVNFTTYNVDVAIPLDSVRSIWNSGARWTAHLDGAIKIEPYNPHRDIAPSGVFVIDNSNHGRPR